MGKSNYTITARRKGIVTSFTEEELGKTYGLFVSGAGVFKKDFGSLLGDMGIFHGGLLLVPLGTTGEDIDAQSFTIQMSAIDWTGTLFPKIKQKSPGQIYLEFHPETEIKMTRGVDLTYWEHFTAVGQVEGYGLPAISRFLQGSASRGLQYRAFEIRNSDKELVMKSSQCYDFVYRTARALTELAGGFIMPMAKASMTNIIIFVSQWEEVDAQDVMQKTSMLEFYRSMVETYKVLRKKGADDFDKVLQNLGKVYKDGFYLFIPGDFSDAPSKVVKAKLTPPYLAFGYEDVLI
uniref:Uncharacterized protein n=1 Tax=Chromera velia CCMP2878 TaxID=1169474 RepID=A0A0G4GJ67_9ALVE|eukprot:Cvel_22117.t1-p1 / transcript=Cvel_22117.t1 / gene=Cvel_22117 / organism=Chromera_velia_CCMP2878 / gene_product=hypothetical protein / transcript_product=hypothetical protein / location=Cvel_scaffold2142:23691-26338(+) / protein_length=291 / sequence_SO=supercontig / SO=protein_coding / is_pseudo=false